MNLIRPAMTHRQRIFLALLLFTLAACSSERNSPADFATSPPIQLRMLEDSQLSVVVQIDGTGPEYRGEQQDNGNWIVRLNVELGAAHTFVSSWYATVNGTRILVLEQRGNFFANADTQTAVATIDNVVVSGDQRFDLDCDSRPNLQELDSGSDPLDPGGCDSDSNNTDGGTDDETNPSNTNENPDNPPAPITGLPESDSPVPSNMLPDMVEIPAGEFVMGSPVNDELRGEDERPHTVSVNGFSIGRYEITFEQYSYFLNQPGTASRMPDDRGWGRGRRPVILITWQEANAYTVWLSEMTGETYRLPTEAEWEYAARAGTTTPFWTGDTIRGDQENVNTESPYGGGVSIGLTWGRTLEVGSLEANPWGLYDMLGNALEYTCSLYDANYEGGLETQCSDDVSQDHIVRGGAYYSGASGARAYRRALLFPTTQISGELGFRVVRENP